MFICAAKIYCQWPRPLDTASHTPLIICGKGGCRQSDPFHWCAKMIWTVGPSPPPTVGRRQPLGGGEKIEIQGIQQWPFMNAFKASELKTFNQCLFWRHTDKVQAGHLKDCKIRMGHCLTIHSWVFVGYWFTWRVGIQLSLRASLLKRTDSLRTQTGYRN